MPTPCTALPCCLPPASRRSAALGGTLLGLALGTLGSAAIAQSGASGDDLDAVTAQAVQSNSQATSIDQRALLDDARIGANPQPFGFSATASTTGGGIHTMLWLSRGAWSLGMGWQQAAVERACSADSGPAAVLACAPPARDATLRVGMGLRAGAHTQLSWDLPLGTGTRADSGLGTGAEMPAATGTRDLRVGLSFATRAPVADLRHGNLMKVELTRQTALALRPRAGRWTISLTSRW